MSATRLAGEQPATTMSGYHWRLLIFLSVATFFEGYDFMALTQILPQVRAELGLSHASAGLLIGVVNAGTVVAYLLVRKADRWGRRRVLMVTIFGYTIFTFLTGLSFDVWSFGLCQFVARMFLIGEWATSMVYAAEEFPTAQRGTLIGVIQAFSSLGSIVCAGVVPLLLQAAWGWRTVYFVGIVPLLLLAFARRNLRETSRFEALSANGPLPETRSMTHIWQSPYRKRLLQLAAVWALTYMCTQNAITFWKEFALSERGWTDGDVGLAITIAAVASMPLVFAAGKLLDVMGRRWGAVLIFTVTSISVVAAYNLDGRWPLTFALMGAIFGVSAVLPVLNAYTAELFPTDLRADAFAWSNNLLGRIGYVTGPVLVGGIAGSTGWGFAVSLTAVFPLVAAGMIVGLFPETRGRTLEQTSQL